MLFTYFTYLYSKCFKRAQTKKQHLLLLDSAVINELGSIKNLIHHLLKESRVALKENKKWVKSLMAKNT